LADVPLVVFFTYTVAKGTALPSSSVILPLMVTSWANKADEKRSKKDDK
jgi:hypothetical protein